MKQLLISATVLLFSTIANAQQATDQQKKDFIAACMAGAIKTGCPPQSTQTPDIREHPAVTIEQIRARNAAAIIQGDNEAARARATLQAPLPAPTVTPALVPTTSVASPAQTQPLPVIETPKPITPTHVFITPVGRHTAAQCGPATAPPGAGWLYGVNRARCLRTAR
jgi:hypothetical protein